MIARCTKIIALFLFVFLFAGCDRPECTNTDAVFASYAPDTKEYKEELIKKLATVNASKLRYWIDKYSEKNGRSYMTIYIQGDSLCAKGILDITNNTRLENYIRVKGVSYSGAELSGLKYHIDTLNNKDCSFVFDGVGRIID